ncbi:MAG: diacylglycerol kinase family lipid kinase [Acidimicrobiales bacterium]|nr:diacylglycerol kinase family lipid kinase [Acidimicrobiales bacterium]
MGDDGGVLRMALLANPAARAGRAALDLDRVVDRLRHHGIHPEFLTAGSPLAAADAARRCVADGVERLLVLGGDGITHLAAGAVAGTSTVMGVIPAGTGNDFARALGLTARSLEDRVDVALADPVALDAIDAGGRTAVSSVIAGFPSNVNARANRMPFPRGASRYTIATLLELPGMRPADYRLVLDGEAHEIRAAVVVVANTRFFGAGMDICPDADPTDGLLDVCIVGDAGRLELLRSFQKVQTGSHIGHPKVTMHRAIGVEIEGVGDIRADGEPFGELPVSLRAVPGALMVAGASAAPVVRD